MKRGSTKELVLAENHGCRERKPFEYLSNKDNIKRAILECLSENDFLGALEMIKIHIKAIKRSEQLEKSTKKLQSECEYERPSFSAHKPAVCIAPAGRSSVKKKA